MLLTLLGIAGIIYGGWQFIHGATGARNIKTIIFCFGVGVLFFFGGIGLIRNTSDKAT